MRSAKPNLITHTSLDLPPHPPPLLFPSLFILHWICHSALKYSCLALKNKCICRKEQKWKREKLVILQDTLMAKVMESFESSRCFRKCGGCDGGLWQEWMSLCTLLCGRCVHWTCLSAPVSPLYVSMWENQDNKILHRGCAAVSTVTSQQQGLGFESQFGEWEDFACSIHSFPPSHAYYHQYECVWMDGVCVLSRAYSCLSSQDWWDSTPPNLHGPPCLLIHQKQDQNSTL